MSIYNYHFQIAANVPDYKRAEGDLTDYDFLSIRVSQTLNLQEEWRKPLINIINSTGGTGRNQIHGTISVLSNERLPEAAIYAIEACFKNWIGIELTHFGYAEAQLESPNIRWSPDSIRTFTPIVDLPIPVLSDAVKTGLNRDSWNNAISSDEARDWMHKQGVDNRPSYAGFAISCDSHQILEQRNYNDDYRLSIIHTHSVGFKKVIS